MANINLQQFIDDLRDAVIKEVGTETEEDIAGAFNQAALKTLAAHIDSGGMPQTQLSLPLTRGQKAAATRKKNVAKRAKAASNAAPSPTIGGEDASVR